MKLDLGIKSDPVEYRYSYPWLFRLMEEEGIRNLQLGSFFELYQLPDAWFRDLRRQAEDHGVAITSVFTAHRELGGFFRDDGPGWAQAARRSFERLIEAAALLGASCVGSNPGAVLRDRMGTKPSGVEVYLEHFRALQAYAGERGIDWLTIEPMSCLAEPPTLPEEMAAFIAAAAQPAPGAARAGLCVDVSHGYADRERRVVHTPMELLEAALPYTCELHLKNTDAIFHSTFGFGRAERARGIIDIPAVRNLLLERSDLIPVEDLVAYFEVGGPKLGRDYSDAELERELRDSLAYLKETFCASPETQAASAGPGQGTGKMPVPRIHARASETRKHGVEVQPSLMCADLCHLERDVRRLEAVGSDGLHLDIMDAHFVPNLPLGLGTVEQLRPITALPLDAHLMVEDPAFFVPLLGRIGVERISVHAESTAHLDRVLALVRDQGALAGLAFNPGTPLDALDWAAERIDFVLLMTVNPGFAGQTLVPNAIRKIRACRAHLDRLGVRVPIQVDGNVSFTHIPDMVAAGADWLVAGTSSLFARDHTLAENMDRTRQAARDGLARRRPPATVSAEVPSR